MVKKKRKGSSSSSTQKPQHITTSTPNKQPVDDLFSALPDSLLLHILSFLDTDKVIRTSLLSRRWRYLWRSIPCLCFGGFDITNFIDRCLFYHDGSKIRKLHITFDYEEDKHAPLVDSWLHFASKSKVEDFELDLFGGDDFDELQYDQLYTLPRSFYLCTTLTSLYLRGCNLNLPDSFQLGSLKKLSLDLIELDPDSIEHLSSSCPLLEDINLSACNRKTDLNIVITNEHVKRLEIFDYGRYGSWNLKINAPTLLSLGIYYCYPSVKFHFENLASLMSVDLIGETLLIVRYEELLYDLEPDDNDMNCVEKLLYGLRHVKHLEMCGLFLRVLSLMKLKSSDILSISATCLELKASLEKWELPGISYLLENCSNLEKLKIVNERFYEDITPTDEFIDKHDFEEDEYWASFETDVPSIMQNIKTIEIDLRDESHHEEFVKFLLKNAKILESMVINTPKEYDKYNYKRLFKLSQRLHAFPRLHLCEDIHTTCFSDNPFWYAYEAIDLSLEEKDCKHRMPVSFRLGVVRIFAVVVLM